MGYLDKKIPPADWWQYAGDKSLAFFKLKITKKAALKTINQYRQSNVVIGAPGFIEPSSSSSCTGGISSSGAIS